MEKAYLDIAKTLTNKTYEREYATSKRIFQKVKNDLVYKNDRDPDSFFYLSLCRVKKKNKDVRHKAKL